MDTVMREITTEIDEAKTRFDEFNLTKKVQVSINQDASDRNVQEQWLEGSDDQSEADRPWTQRSVILAGWEQKKG